MPTIDEQLLLRAKTGDKNALSDLLLRHGPPIRSGLTINPKWRSVLDADDIMQITYFEAFGQIAHFKGAADSFPGWLQRIAENNLRDAIDWLQREKRPQPEQRVTKSEQHDPLAWLFDLISGGAGSPSRHAMGNETLKLIEDEIDNLPRDYAEVMKGIFLEGRPVADVADQMGKTTGAVHLLRIRAIERLRARLGSGSKFLSYPG